MILFFKVVCFLVAALFVGLIVLADSACPLMRCNGPEGDGWMLPFFFAPIGIPGFIASLIFLAKGIAVFGRKRR
jgi:hypothetical protein